MSIDSNNFEEISVNVSTIVDTLCYRKNNQPDKIAYTFLQQGETESNSLTYQKLDWQARAIAAQLQLLKVTGERALLLYPSGLEFIVAFLGCLYAGVVAVPAYPPRRNQNIFRLQTIVVDAQASVVLTTTSLLPSIKIKFAHNPELKVLRWLATDNISNDLAKSWQKPNLHGSTLAFLQYTSGSTGTPKGVMVTHGNLLHNSAFINKRFKVTPNSLGVSWLPLYHDMGLIGGVIQPLYAGIPIVLMSPIDFIQKPLRWLQAISQYQATISGGPNFAYDLCLRKISPEQLASLDLSTWKVAFNGAEPIRAETLESFAKYFSHCGFRSKAFYPCYGMAETTLMVSGGVKTESTVIRWVKSVDLEQNRVVATTAEQKDARSIVSCGQNWLDHKIAIVNPQSLTRCLNNQVGEIWVFSKSVTQGYWNRPKQTQEIYHAYLKDTGEGPFLRTGDLGFLQDGELFVTGRIKDLVIIRGRNHYPQDIEQTAQKIHPALRPNCGAAFSVETAGRERLVIAHEVERSYLRKLDIKAVAEAIRRVVAEEHNLQVYAVLLLKTGSLPKTSSGKIQRHTCRSQYLAESLDVVADWCAGLPGNTEFLDLEADREKLLDEALTGQESEADSGSNESDLVLAGQLQADNVKVIQRWLVAKVAAQLNVTADEIEIDRPLTNYGLDSLAAMSITGELQDCFGRAFSPTLLYDYPSIQNLAQYFVHEAASIGGLPKGSAERSLQLKKITRDVKIPLSFAQQRLWFLNQLEGDSVTYNIPVALRLSGPLHVEALEQTIKEIVQRHEILRTTFPTINGTPVQLIDPTLSVRLSIVDLQSQPEAIQFSEMQRLATEESRFQFDLAQGPLMRVTLLILRKESHVLLLTMHHIISDGWSMGVLTGEFSTLYASFSKGEPSPLPELTIQYADFAYWQRQWLHGETFETQLNYWQKQLAGAPPMLKLPTDRSRPPVQTFKGCIEYFELPTDLTKKLKNLSQKSGATLFMALLTAFAILLSRYSGQEDISVGSPIANRHHQEIKPLIGFFANTILLRVDLQGNPSFQELLGRVRQVALEAYAHQDLPFEQLVEALQPERNLSHNPLFQVMFIMQNASIENLELPGLTVTDLELDRVTAKFDLTLSITETESRLKGSWEYNSDLFEAATIRRMINHLGTLLEGIVANPQQLVSELPLLMAAERHQLLFEWNKTQTEYPKDKSIHQLFEAQVKRTPDAVAVIFEDQQLTYWELNSQANQLANYLQALGVGPEVLTGIYVERSLELLLGLLAILKAGGAYVPLDLTYPNERIEYMLADAEVRVLLTQEKLRNNLPSYQGQVICLDANWQSITQENKQNPVSSVEPDKLAYTIYTSGSTGKPKGVQITHQGVVNFLTAINQELNLTERDILLAVTTICFDIAVLELYLPLMVGAKIVLASSADVVDGEQLSKKIEQDRVTVMQATPAGWRLLLSVGWQPTSKLKILCGGEALSLALAHQLQNKGNSVWNLYGPTEATVWSTIYQLPGEEEKIATESTSVSIGRPIANTKIYILNRHLQVLPVGVPGEIYIGGAGLAKGYLNRPKLTSKKFIPSPFSDSQSKRLYKTGDLGKYLPDGNIELIGRIDNQVKIRGFRIELGEIEAVLSQHPAVQETVVIILEDNPGDKRLVAYIVPNQEQPTMSQMRHFLKKLLPDYMVPTAFVLLEKLPLTPNGKVDRRALPALGASSRNLVSSFMPPRTSTEKVLAAIWAEVLGLEQVSIHDNFFELGGHSLIATQLIYKLRETFPVELSLRSFFESPTIADLSKYIETSRLTRSDLQIPPITQAPRNKKLPLSFPQQRLWFLWQLKPNSPFFNMPFGIHFSGSLDITVLEQSLNEIIRRHEILRTNFTVLEKQPVQVIEPSLSLRIPIVNLSTFSKDEREAKIQQLAAEEAQQPFDLTLEKLLRATLLRLVEDEHVLLLTIHHIVFDGWSVAVFMRELLTIYSAFSAGKSSPLPELTIQYADFTLWQRQWLQGEILEAQLTYWKERLKGVPELKFPFARPRLTRRTFQGARQNLIVSKSLTDMLKDLSKKEGVTLFITLLAAFKALLFYYSQQTDILVGSPRENRILPETKPLIGLFTDMLALRTDLSGNPHFRELINRVRDTFLKSYAHQNVPFELATKILPSRDNISYSQQFQVEFVFLDFPWQVLEKTNLKVKLLEFDNRTAKIDLKLYIWQSKNELNGYIEYSTELFNTATIIQIIKHFNILLKRIAITPDKCLSSLLIF